MTRSFGISAPAAAAALASLDVYANEELFARSRELAPCFESALHELAGAPHVVDVRNLGLMGAIELSPRADAPTLRAQEVFRRAFDAGVLIRTTGDTIAVTPPLIISEAQIRQITATLAEILARVA